VLRRVEKMAHFFKPFDEPFRGYTIDRLLAPDSVGSIEVKVGGTKRIGLWGGGDLWRKVKDTNIVNRAIFSRPTGQDTEILLVEGIAVGTTQIEIGQVTTKWTSLEVIVVKEEIKADYFLVIGIDPSSVNKSDAVDTAKNPGHTIVGLKDSFGKLTRIFSYGPAKRDAIACSGPGTGFYHLLANDLYKMYEWPITKEQYAQAVAKMQQIELTPGTFNVNHQCTTTSLEVVQAAGVSIPNGTGDISIPICDDGKGVAAPIFLDRALEKQFISEGKPIIKMRGISFTGLVDVQSK
jgi:hypothetical protein